MGLKDEGHSLILNIQFLTVVHLCGIRADGDGTETQDGTYRIFRKKRTSETALVRGGDMGELNSQLEGTAPLLKPNLGCSG